MRGIVEIFDRFEDPKIKKKTFLETENKRYTYQDLLSACSKVANLFSENNIQLGDHVILANDSDWETIILFLGALRCGVVPVLIDPEINENRVQSIIKLTEPSGLFLKDSLLEKLGSSLPDVFSMSIKTGGQKKGKLFKKLMKRKEAAVPEETPKTFPAILDHLTEGDFPGAVSEENTAYVIFTSGTTSDPKGVVISHKNLFTHLQTLSKVYQMDEKTNLLNILRFFQVDGIIQGPILAVYNLASLYRPIAFDITKIAQLFGAIYKYRITHFITVPTMLRFLLQFSEGHAEDFLSPDFKYIISSSAALHEDLWTAVEGKFQRPIINMYGLSETVTGSVYSGVTDDSRRIGSIGKPVDCKAKIIDENGQSVGIDQPGELLLSGDHIMQGYLKNPEATSAALRDGWLHTGDIATIDEAGFYYITGRLKNVVISGGINIYPEMVTDIINQHPKVFECVCLGMPDPIFEEVLVAAVVPTPSAELSEIELINYCRQEMEDYKVPHEIFIFDELPKGHVGKVQLRQLKEQIEAKKEPQQLIESSHRDQLFYAASKAFKVPVESISIQHNSRTLDGWDSMNHLQFVVLLEKQFQTRFSTAEIMTMDSLESAEKILLGKLSN